MKVMILIGRKKTGKTTTLNTLITRLKSDNAEVIRDEKHGADCMTSLEHEGKRIVIATAGDSEVEVNNALRFAEEEIKNAPIDILILASRTRGGAFDAAFNAFKDIRQGVPLFVYSFEQVFDDNRDGKTPAAQEAMEQCVQINVAEFVDLISRY